MKATIYRSPFGEGIIASAEHNGLITRVYLPQKSLDHLLYRVVVMDFPQIYTRINESGEDKLPEKQMIEDYFTKRKPMRVSLSRLDLSCISPFRQQVYRAVSSINLGSTCSYGEIAMKIGKPGSARAVGQALRNNPFPLLIPCHRIIRSDGNQGGFVGKENNPLKKLLLDHEGYHT